VNASEVTPPPPFSRHLSFNQIEPIPHAVEAIGFVALDGDVEGGIDFDGAGTATGTPGRTATASA